MEGGAVGTPGLVGREAELGRLAESLGKAVAGSGSAMMLAGEPGIGKTRLVQEFRARAAAMGAEVLSGAAEPSAARPFSVLSKALAGRGSAAVFSEQEQVSFSQVFAINAAGLLVAKASSAADELDADIFAGMLSAVQSFVRDSFGQPGDRSSGLGRLEYGDMKILIEHGSHLFLTAVISGQEHADMRVALRHAVHAIESRHGKALERWRGNASEVAGVQAEVGAVARQRFTVRRSLEGLRVEDELRRMADAVLEEFAARGRPVLLVLEDLHWADDASLFIMGHLARNAPRMPLMVLGTCRPRESEALAKRLEAMEGEGIVKTMVVERLGPEHVASIVGAAFPGHRFPDSFVAELAERCGGTPLFVVELLRHMAAEGSIALSGGAYALLREDYTIPGTVEDVIRERLAALGPEALALAEYASCIGVEFDPELAGSARLVGDHAAAMEELRASGVLSQAGSPEFSHALYQAVLYSTLSPRWRASHHRSIGERLESLYEGREGEAVFELARHFGHTSDHTKAFAYSLRAAEKAESGYALDQAVQFYEAALATGPRLGAAFPPEKAVEVRERLGELHVLAGQYHRALDRYREALGSTQDAEAASRLRRRCSFTLEKMGRFDDALAEAVEAKEAAPQGSAERWRALSQEGYVMLRKNDYDKTVALCTEAADRFRDMGSEADAAKATNLIGLACWYKQDFERAMEHHEQALKVMERLGDEAEMQQIYNNIGNCLDALGKSEPSMHYYRKALEIAERRHDQQSIGVLYNNIGLTLQSIGDPEEAMRCQEKALEIRMRIGDSWGIVASHSNIGQVQRHLGLDAEALESFKRSNALARKAEILPFLLGSGLSAVEILIEFGRLDEAEAELPEYEELANRSGAKGFIAFATHVRGQLQLAQGKHREAAETLEKSALLFESLKMMIQAANVRTFLGEALIGSGRADEGRRIVRECLATFEEAKQGPYIKRCREILGGE